MCEKTDLEFLNNIRESANKAIIELIEQANLTSGSLVVVGCSSSEIAGGVIGHDSSIDCARAAFDGIAPVLEKNKLFLCAQCCEHLNRAIIMEKEAADKYGYDPVCVVPQPKAGGSFATISWQNMKSPVAVEEIRAHAGIDIGGTLIGMHLRKVAVPVRLSVNKIGNAIILCAKTRPKYIGGIRAKYE